MFDFPFSETAPSIASKQSNEVDAVHHDEDEKPGSPLYDRALAEIRAQTDAELAEVNEQIRQHDRDLPDAFQQAFGRLDASNPLAAIATPAEMHRTAVRIMLMTLHRGLEKTSLQIRQLPEAQALSQALYAASEFFNRDYDPARSTDELRKLCDVMVAFAGATRGYDPWMLGLYAMGDLKARKRGRESSVVPFRR